MEMKESGVRVPNLNAEIIPSVSAAGFKIGEELSAIKQQIGQWEFCDEDMQVGPFLLKNEGWLIKEGRMLDGHITTSLYFKNELVRLSFGRSQKLYQIMVGRGYKGGFAGIVIGDDILSLEEYFTVEFESSEDAFYIARGEDDILGISFVTDYRAPLEIAPHQTIEGILISNYAVERVDHSV